MKNNIAFLFIPDIKENIPDVDLDADPTLPLSLTEPLLLLLPFVPPPDLLLQSRIMNRKEVNLI